METAAATPVAPLEPSRPARWGQVLIGVEEVEAVEAAQRREGEPASPADLALDHVVGADDRITAEVARAVARSEDGEEDQAWSPADAGALVELADTQADDVGALRALIYILAHDNGDVAKKHWAEFTADPEWQKVSKASEADGKIVEKVESTFMVPSDYSPMK